MMCWCWPRRRQIRWWKKKNEHSGGTSSFTPSGSFPMVDLPRDIQYMIIEIMKPPDGPLFVPTPVSNWQFPAIGEKMKVRYGEPDDDQVQLSEGLLNWSSTSRYFRDLIAPILFETVVIRPRPKSLGSFKSLQQSRYWSEIKHLMFVSVNSTIESDSLPGELGEHIWYLMKYEPVWADDMKMKVRREMEEISQTLARLPPNLTSLICDFSATDYQMQNMNSINFPVYPNHNDRHTAELLDPICFDRALLSVVLDSISRCGIPAESDFDLSLHNIPPAYSKVYHQLSFHRLLNKITTFTLSLYNLSKSRDMWYLDTIFARRTFAENLGCYFFDHLDNVRKFRLNADKLWPLGCVPDNSYVKLPLPATLDSLAHVEHVSFEWILIGPEITRFLTSRAKQLRTIELVDCHCAGILYPDDTTLPSWSTFFDTLLQANFDKLISFVVRFKQQNVEAKMCSAADEQSIEDGDVMEFCHHFQRQYEEEDAAFQCGASKAAIRRWRRWLFPYYRVSGVENGVEIHQKLTAAHFVLGRDYTAYLRMIESVMANAGYMDEATLAAPSYSSPHSSYSQNLQEEVRRISGFINVAV